MNPATQLFRQGPVNQTLAGDAAKPAKGFRNDLDPKMGLALGTGPRVPGVARRFVHHLEPDGIQRLIEFGDDLRTNFHVQKRLKAARNSAHPRSLFRGALPPILQTMSRFKSLGAKKRAESAGAAMRRCDHEDCVEPGVYPAPRNRDSLKPYYWFCLDHVREYNRAWNYFAGMSVDEVEHFVREDIVGWRPTWPVGLRGKRFGRGRHFYDAFGFFKDKHAGPEDASGGSGGNGSSTPFVPKSREGRALALFNLKPPIGFAAIKARYKQLVKRHHPDANNGDKRSEEKLKLINEAYGILKRFFA